MKTGNNAKPNPRGLFGRGFSRETSNEVKNKSGGSFSAKKDSFTKGKKHG